MFSKVKTVVVFPSLTFNPLNAVQTLWQMLLGNNFFTNSIFLVLISG